MNKQELQASIENLLTGGYKKNKRSRMIELYHLAFPHSGLDTNCPGCTIQVWGKLEKLQKEGYLSLKINNIPMAKSIANRYQFKNLAENETKSYPKLRLFALNNETLTDGIANRLIKAGFGDDIIDTEAPAPTAKTENKKADKPE